MPLWVPESAWRPPNVGDLPSWDGAKRIGFDFETRDPHIKELGCGARRPGSYVVGFSFAIEDGPDYYVPIRHEGGDNVEDANQALRYLGDQLKRYTGILTGAYLSYEQAYLLSMGLEWNSELQWRDIQIADPLINEHHFSYSLQAIADRRGIPGKDEKLLREAARDYGVDPKGGMWKLPARFVGPYAAQDAVLPLQLLRKQEREIEEQDLWGVFDLECKVQPVLSKMRHRGVRIDQDQLRKVEQWSLAQEGEALAKVKAVTGHTIEVGDVWKADALAPALERIGVTVPTSITKGKARYNIDKFFLAAIDHEVADALAWSRKVNKLRTTFAASIRRFMVDGRIHTTFNQLKRTKEEQGSEDTAGAAYGRLSSENPNLQQQPARDEFAIMWRSIYLPEEDSQWGACDYSQQEPRMLVHFAAKMDLPRAREAAQRYKDKPDTDSHDMMSDMTGAKRSDAKQLFLGKCYGMGGAKLCMSLGLPTRWKVFFKGPYAKRPSEKFFESQVEALNYARENTNEDVTGVAFLDAGKEGRAIIDQFDDRLPYVKKLAAIAKQRAASKGYVVTLSGRRCRFPLRDDGAFDWTQKALNRVIQGSAGDQTKQALIAADAAGYFIQLQVHDEIDGSFSSRKEAEGLGEVMEHAYELELPFTVDIEMGTSWGNSMEKAASG